MANIGDPITIDKHGHMTHAAGGTLKPTSGERRGLGSRIWEFMTVVSGPRVTEEVFEQRLAICSECDRLHRDRDKLYCRACGCGAWRMAELHSKLWWARLECPLVLPKFQKGITK